MDLGDTFYFEAVRQVYMREVNSKKGGFASAVEKATGSINKVLQKANDTALELE